MPRKAKPLRCWGIRLPNGELARWLGDTRAYTRYLAKEVWKMGKVVRVTVREEVK